MTIKAWAERFDKMQLNERRLILLAAVGGILLLGYSLFIEPAQTGAKFKEGLLAQQEGELATLNAQLQGLRQQAGNPDAELKQDIGSTQKQIGTVETELRQFDHMLVVPAQMPQLLQSLLAKHRGLELVRLKTLPAQPLLSPVTAAPASAPTNQAQPAATGDKPAPPPGGIYRHGMEITISGSYAELTAYAAELQRISPRPLWSAMQLKVVEYPRSELTFTLYTLSLDLPWLTV